MSHFTKMKMQAKSPKLTKRVAKQLDWTVEEQACHVNSWSKEEVKDATVLKNAGGKVMGVIDKEGNVIHDSFYMGRDINRFLQGYASEHIRSKAMVSGGTVRNKGMNASGELVLEVEM